MAERLADEFELLGAYLSAHPLEPLSRDCPALSHAASDADGSVAKVAGVVVGLKITETRRGGTMAFAQL